MVLSAAGNSQTLYVDNAKIGSRTGTVSIQSAVAFGKNQSFNYLGTGFLGGNWPDEPHQSSSEKSGYATYFNGSVADAAWYGRPLVAADVNALYQYGTHAASLLTSITRPSGKTYAAMQYDPGTTTLTQLTDENGGVWKLGAPTVTTTTRPTGARSSARRPPATSVSVRRPARPPRSTRCAAATARTAR